MSKSSYRIETRALLRCVGIAAVSFTLVACGGRAPRPVAERIALDANLTCQHIVNELENNLKKAQAITGEKGDKVGYNLGILLVSPFFLDFSRAQQKEIESLHKRNERLMVLNEEKGCAPLPNQEAASTVM